MEKVRSEVRCKQVRVEIFSTWTVREPYDHINILEMTTDFEIFKLRKQNAPVSVKSQKFFGKSGR